MVPFIIVVLPGLFSDYVKENVYALPLQVIVECGSTDSPGTPPKLFVDDPTNIVMWLNENALTLYYLRIPVMDA